MYREEDYLNLSGIQHFVFCRRQWALIHIEQQWEENFRTADGRIMHENVHNASFHEKRGNVIISRALRVSSPRLGISGECDAVEFHKDKCGVNIVGLEGKFRAVPVEYKRGSQKVSDCDRMQLCAQVLCLEEMLCCTIPKAYLFYGETRHREEIVIDEKLRADTEAVIAEMHSYYDRQYTPKGKRTKSCNACSLKDLCLPVICTKRSVSEYISGMLGGEEL